MVESGIHVEIAAEKLGEFSGIPITNTLLASWVAIAILVLVALAVGSRLKMMPGRLQSVLEHLVEFVYDYVAQTLGGRDMARKYFPLLMTVFLFIFVANMLEFTPLFGSFVYVDEHGAVPLLRSANTDLNVPFALAIIAFFVIEISGIVAIGAWKYLKKFFDLRSPIAFFVGIVEFIGEFARTVSLAFRLFGNIFAGEVVIAVALYFAPYLGPVPLMMFEIFIGTLQAAIFALLMLFFLKLAVAEPH